MNEKRGPGRPKNTNVPSKSGGGIAIDKDIRNEQRELMETSRIPMSAAQRLPVPKHLMSPGYYYRWCADYGVDKISRYLAAGYEYVVDDEGNRIHRNGGDKLTLMKLPQEYREQDEAAKNGMIIDVNRKQQHDMAPDTAGAVPEYLPKGSDSTFIRDNL